VAVGGSIGLCLGGLIPERVRSLVFQLFGLCLVGVAMGMIMEGSNFILVVLSCALGGVTGVLLRLPERLDSLGDALKGLVGSKNPQFTEGLITSSVLVCVGAMSIVGAFEEGLGKGRTTVLTKATIDFFSVMILASRSGSGVVFCFVPILVYQGALTMLAGYVSPLLSPLIETTLTATGGVLVLGIALNMVGLKEPVNVTSSIPALVWAVILPALLQAFLPSLLPA
jgi:uncharacterized membrane protein YqgA involved in biofilm formation